MGVICECDTISVSKLLVWIINWFKKFKLYIQIENVSHLMGYSDDTNMAFSALKYTHTSIFELFIQCVCVYGVNEINIYIFKSALVFSKTIERN